MNGKIKFSVVTVCYNAVDTIEMTMSSVLSQTYCEYEYVIMDGASTDGTVQRIEGQADRFGDKLLFVSEPDHGLYHAMNKAAKKCSCDYIIYMNSGDTFYDNHVLQKTAELIGNQESPAQLYYGDVERVYQSHSEIERYPGKHVVMKLLLMGKMPCHQSVFTRTEIMRKYGFDETYSITADYNFLMECKKHGHTMGYLPFVVSRSECAGGISSQQENLNLMRMQDDKSLKEHYPIWYYLLKPVKYLKRRILG